MSHKSKPVPQRTCVVCRSKSDKRHLTRFVHTPDGIFADPTGKHNGRGAYVCDAPTCQQRAATTDILGHALRVVLTDADRQRIREAAL